MLNLSYNPFHPGRIPAELGNLTNLEVLWLIECNLVGEIPDSLGRLKNLKDLDLAINGLTGRIPPSLSELTSVVQIELYDNPLTGGLPPGMSKLTRLRLLDASMNQLKRADFGRALSVLREQPGNSGLSGPLEIYRNSFLGSGPLEIYRKFIGIAFWAVGRWKFIGIAFWGILVFVEIWMGCVIAEPRLKVRGTYGCLGACSFCLV